MKILHIPKGIVIQIDKCDRTTFFCSRVMLISIVTKECNVIFQIYTIHCIQHQADSSRYFSPKIGPLSSLTSLHDLTSKFQHKYKMTFVTFVKQTVVTSVRWTKVYSHSPFTNATGSRRPIVTANSMKATASTQLSRASNTAKTVFFHAVSQLKERRTILFWITTNFLSIAPM